MKNIIVLMIIFINIATFACPSYSLSQKTQEELNQEFSALYSKIDKNFQNLLENFGYQSYIEFKTVISSWMELYTKYECWIDISDDKNTKAPTDKNKDWLKKLEKISVLLGKGINEFSSKNIINSKNYVEMAYNEFQLTLNTNYFSIESKIMKELSQLVKDKDYTAISNYIRLNAENLKNIERIIKNNYKKFNLNTYYSLFSSVFNKLSSTIDNNKKIDYTIVEIKKDLDKLSLYRFNNMDKIKKMWAKVK